MTMDRNFIKSFEKINNDFGTLPRTPQNKLPSRAKLHAIRIFTNLFQSTNDVNIIDKEHNYLQ